MKNRDIQGKFIKGNHPPTEFKKGNPPPAHKEGCRCFRCSRTSWNKGKKMPADVVKAMSERSLNMPQDVKKRIGKTIKNIWKNPEYRQRMTEAHIGQPQPREEASHNWKGDQVQYRALHQWVERVLGKPTKCEKCGKVCTTRNSIHWANKTGKYLRDIKDWFRLCVKCHRQHDKSLKLVVSRYCKTN